MRALAKVVTHFRQNLPLVAFRKPNSTQVELYLQPSQDWYVWDAGQEGFVVVDFFWEKPFYFPSSVCDRVSFKMNANVGTIPYPEFAESNADQIAFEKLVQDATNAIQQGMFEKVVVSRKIEVNKTSDFQLLVNRLFSRFPNAFTFLYYHPNIGCWVGATPEILLQKNENKYQTVALAGTTYQSVNKNIRFTEKELEEQQIVANYFQKILSNEIENLHVSPPKIIQAANLQHLKSEVTFEVKDHVSDVAILRKIHPTPAVGGDPKEAVLAWLKSKEGYQRAYYAGFLGEFSPKKIELYVQLRCMLWQEEQQTLFVGCGITKDSQPENEFWETHEKAKTMIQLLE